MSYINCVGCGLQDHESVERCDHAITADVNGGDLLVAVEVTFLRRAASPWLYQRESIDAATAARDQVWVIADAVSVRVGAGVVGVVVASGAGVSLIVVVASGHTR